MPKVAPKAFTSIRFRVPCGVHPAALPFKAASAETPMSRVDIIGSLGGQKEMAQRRRDPQGAKTRKPESKRGGTRRCRPHTTRCRAVGLEGELQAAGDCDDVVVVVADLFRTDEAGDEDGHARGRSEEHTSELQSLLRISYAV